MVPISSPVEIPPEDTSRSDTTMKGENSGASSTNNKHSSTKSSLTVHVPSTSNTVIVPGDLTPSPLPRAKSPVEKDSIVATPHDVPPAKPQTLERVPLVSAPQNHAEPPRTTQRSGAIPHPSSERDSWEQAKPYGSSAYAQQQRVQQLERERRIAEQYTPQLIQPPLQQQQTQSQVAYQQQQQQQQDMSGLRQAQNRNAAMYSDYPAQQMPTVPAPMQHGLRTGPAGNLGASLDARSYQYDPLQNAAEIMHANVDNSDLYWNARRQVCRLRPIWTKTRGQGAGQEFR